jgi:hypothetical protein
MKKKRKIKKKKKNKGSSEPGPRHLSLSEGQRTLKATHDEGLLLP